MSLTLKLKELSDFIEKLEPSLLRLVDAFEQFEPLLEMAAKLFGQSGLVTLLKEVKSTVHLIKEHIQPQQAIQIKPTPQTTPQPQQNTPETLPGINYQTQTITDKQNRDIQEQIASIGVNLAHPSPNLG
jgi:hypothetical protein